MHKYEINDVWMALRLASKNFFILITIFIITYMILISFFENNKMNEYKDWLQIVISFLTVLIFIQSIFIYFANRKYIVDLNTGMVTFPRSDIENSIVAIILLLPYWNLLRTITIKATEIENIYIDTRRWTTKYKVSSGTTSSGKSKYRTETINHIRYTLNIVGTFGSANLQFLDRQKRDEVRNAIEQCTKVYNGRNVDTKVAEF